MTKDNVQVHISKSQSFGGFPNSYLTVSVKNRSTACLRGFTTSVRHVLCKSSASTNRQEAVPSLGNWSCSGLPAHAAHSAQEELLRKCGDLKHSHFHWASWGKCSLFPIQRIIQNFHLLIALPASWPFLTVGHSPPPTSSAKICHLALANVNAPARDANLRAGVPSVAQRSPTCTRPWV